MQAARRAASNISDPYIKSRRKARLSVVKNSWYPTSKRHVRKMLLPGLSIAYLLTSLLFLTWIRVSELTSAYRIADLEKEYTSLNDHARALRLEIAVLKRPERIRRIATQDLHMRSAIAIPLK